MHFLDATITLISIWGAVWAFQLSNKGKDNKDKPQQVKRLSPFQKHVIYKQELKNKH